jgi:hypothetical protein
VLKYSSQMILMPFTKCSTETFFDSPVNKGMLAKSRVTACTNNPLADTTDSRGAEGGARDDPITGGGRGPDCARIGESTFDGMGVPSATSCDDSRRLHLTQILFDVLEPVSLPSGILLCHSPSKFTSHEGNFLSRKLFPELFQK